MGQRVSDPIAVSQANLDDPERWVIEVGVPVFVPHTRTNPDGSVAYTVTEDDLPEIAARSAEAEKAGTVPVQTIGHRNYAKDADETKQPPLIGFERNWRVGEFNGRPAVVCDVYTAKDEWDRAKSFPYRSADYWPNQKRITGVARLLRDPWLNVGTTVYQHPDGPLYRYAMGEDQTPEMTPEEQGLADKVYRYMCSKNKWMGHYAKQYEAGSGPGFPSGNNTHMATETKKPDETPAQNQAPAVTVEQYQAMQADLQKVRDQNSALMADIEGAKVDRILDELERVERYQFDRPAERARLIALPAADRQKRVEEIRKYHHRLPGADEIEVYRGRAEGPTPGTTDDQARAATKYASKHSCTYDEAIVAVKAGKS